MSAKSKPNELYIERVFDAPVKMVWEAWTEPEQVAQWWGPRGFTITTDHKDVRTGGSWRYTMHGPDGVDYPNHTKFLEVEQFARLVYDHGGYDDRPPLFRVTVNFSEVQGATKMEMTMALATEQAAKETKQFVKKVGGDTTWDRLAEYLSPTDRFVINRTFESPIETMFEMWTNPKHVAEWLPPTGFTVEYLRADIKPRGSSFIRMSGEGGAMYAKFDYQDIQRPHRIVYKQVFCDAEENVSRPPFDATWPEAMLTTVTLTEESPDRTRVTLHTEVHGEASPVERETFRKGKAGMTLGWTGSFNKLEALVE